MIRAANRFKHIEQLHHKLRSQSASVHSGVLGHSSSARQNFNADPRRLILKYAAATCIAAVSMYALGGDSLFADSRVDSVVVSDELVTAVSLDFDSVKEARKNIGVYAWGSNSAKIINGASEEITIRSPQSLKGKVLRDIVLNETYAVAVDRSGDVYEWGLGFDGKADPKLILKNRDIKQIVCSANEILLLSKTGYIYSLPIAQSDQQTLMATRLAALKNCYYDPIYWTQSSEERCLDRYYPGIKVSKIAGGSDHLFAMQTNGDIKSMSLSALGNSFGQLGQDTIDPFCSHKFLAVPTLSPVTDIACGNNHTIFTTRDGKIYGIGSNVYGQLASGSIGEIPAIIQTPTEIQTIWNRFQKAPQPEGSHCVMIAAGADLSYFAVKGEQGSELLSAGYGVNAQLGNGSPHPVKVKRLSDLSEWDDASNSVKQIGIQDLQCSSTHTAAILSNERSTGFGRDVFVWGLNQKGQLNKIDGKKSVAATPVWASAIDYEGDGRAQGRLSLSPEFVVDGVRVEQALVCGPGITAAYMRVI